MSVELKFCPYCGSALLLEAQRFCSACGRSLARTAAATGPAVAEADGTSPVQMPVDPTPQGLQHEPHEGGAADIASSSVTADGGADAPRNAPAPEIEPGATLAAPMSSTAAPRAPASPFAGVAGTSPATLTGSTSIALHPAHVALGAAGGLGLAVALPWLTFFSLSMSPLQLLNQSGYWLLVAGVALAAIVLAVITISRPRQVASRPLWASLAITFGAAVLLSAFVLVSFADARSQGGLTGIVAGSAGIGPGFWVYGVASVCGAVVSLRTWVTSSGPATAATDTTQPPAQATGASADGLRIPDAVRGAASSTDAVASVHASHGQPAPTPTGGAFNRDLADGAQPAGPSQPPAAVVPASSTAMGPAIVVVGAVVLVIVLAAVFVSQSKSRSDVLALAGTACSQATAWQNDSRVGNPQAQSDQSALYATLQQLTSQMQTSQASGQAQADLTRLTVTVQMGILNAPDLAAQECQTLQGQLQQDLGSQGSNP